MGIPNFNVAFYKDPELTSDILEYFTIGSTRETVETLREDRLRLF